MPFIPAAASCGVLRLKIKGLCVYDAVPENYNVEDYSKGVRIKNPYSFPLRIDDRIKTY